MTSYNLDELAQTLFEESGDALFLFDPDTDQLLDVNPMAQRLTGWARPDLLRYPVTYFFRAEQQGGLSQLRQAYRKTGLFHSQEGFLMRHRRDGVWLPVNLTVTRLHTDRKTLGLVTARDITERRDAQAALKKTEEELRRVLASVSDCVWSAEVEGGRAAVRYCSPVVERLTGRPPEFFLADYDAWWRTARADDRDRVRGALDRLRAGRSDYEDVEYRLDRPGGPRWVRNRVVLNRADNGHGPRIDGVLSDVHDRKLAEEAVRLSEERFRALVEKSVDGIALLAADGTVRYVSPSSHDTLGHGPELIGSSAFDLVHPDDDATVRALWQKCLNRPGEAVPVEFRLRHHDGRWLQMEGTAVNRLADPAVAAVVLNSRDVSERRRTEGALRESEARFQAFMANSPVIAFMKDEEGRYVYGNTTWARRFGSEPAGLLGRTDFDLWPEAIARMFRDSDRTVLETDRPLARVEAGQLPGQGLIEWMTYKFPIRDAAGRRLLGGVVVDTSERRRAEAALRAGEERYRLLFERNLAGVFRTTAAGAVLDCNDSFARILGYAGRDEALARPASDFYLDPADRQALLARLHAAQTLTGVELCMRRQDGQPVWVLESVSLLEGDDGEPVLQGTIIDISDRKRAEEALRTSEAKYRSLLENLEQSIFLKDRESRYVAGNRPFCEGLGLTEATLPGKNDFDFFPTDMAEKYRADDRRVLIDGRRLELEEESLIFGKPRTVRTIKTPWRDGQGRILGVLGIYWDVTEQRQLEAQLRQAQKMEEIGRLAGGVAHDFNNILTVILGNLSLIQGGLPANDPARELAAAAEKASLRAANLTTQLLGFARQTMLRPQATHVNGLIGEVVQFLGRTIDPRILIEPDLAPDLWVVWADPNQLNQVLMNLCLNARDAMSDGGRLRLATANVVLDEAYARRHLEGRAGEFVRLRVADSGCGMTDEVRARVFEPFFTTKGPGKGTGLGLAMVFGIVKQHYGWIDVLSVPGRGTTFDIYLPRHLPKVEPDAGPAPPTLPTRGTETVLLADDQELIRNLGRTILERYGYRVLLAEDGQAAVETYERRRDEIDLVILDLMMPRLSGRDAFQRLVRLNPAVKVLFASGYSAEHVTPEEHEQSCGFIGKPYRPDQLVATVRAALDRKG
jgi:two-component system, cell cycle sensor histidine kinase and response regulator CckA